MKLQIVSVLALCGLFTACNRSGDSSSASLKEYDEQLKQQLARHDAYEKQAKLAEEQLKAQAEMQKQGDDLLRAQQEMHKRAEALLESQAQFVKREQDDIARFERILETWEHQQKQYQKYLDSLDKK